MKNAIQVKNLVKKYGDFTAVDSLTFNVGRGELFGFLGPNGAGKTTLMNVLTGLIPPIAGRIFLLGHDVTKLPSHTRVSFGLARSLL